MEWRSWGLLLPLLLATLAGAQYEKYSFRGFPEVELLPLQHTYAYVLEQYEGEGWKERVHALEASLRLHRLLRDSKAHYHQECAGGSGEGLGEPWLGEPAFGELGPGAAPDKGLAELELFRSVLWHTSCLRCCKRSLSLFQLHYPLAKTLHNFQQCTLYLYLHYTLYKVKLYGLTQQNLQEKSKFLHS